MVQHNIEEVGGAFELARYIILYSQIDVSSEVSIESNREYIREVLFRGTQKACEHFLNELVESATTTTSPAID